MSRNPFKSFLYFPKGDRQAIVALGCIAVFAVGVLMLMEVWSERNAPASSVSQADEDSAWTTSQGKNTPPIFAERHRSFDPNTVDSLTLVHMGIKAWKVKNFLHYRAAGKVFRSAEDMGNTYGWTEEDVARVAPYVRVGAVLRKKEEVPRFEERREQKTLTPRFEPRKFQTLTLVDVNEADTALLRRIPGVGEKISEAIVRYRERLGGFHSVEQLREISIVSPELLEWFAVAPRPSLKTFNINKASFHVLNSHPYISYEQAKALRQYVRLYGDVKDEEMLLTTGIFTEEEVERLRPYITYE